MRCEIYWMVFKVNSKKEDIIVIFGRKECPRNERRYLRIENVSNGATSINLNILNCFIFRYFQCWHKIFIGHSLSMCDTETSEEH